MCVTENRSSWPTAVESLLRASLSSLFLTQLSKCLPDNSVFLTEFLLPLYMSVCVCLGCYVWFVYYCLGFFSLSSSTHVLFYLQNSHEVSDLLSIQFQCHTSDFPSAPSCCVYFFETIYYVFLFKIHNTLRRKTYGFGDRWKRHKHTSFFRFLYRTFSYSPEQSLLHFNSIHLFRIWSFEYGYLTSVFLI